MPTTACTLPAGGGDAGPPCDAKAMAVTSQFGNRVGRVVETDDGQDTESKACYVAVAVLKTRGSDPLRIIDDAVAATGWERKGKARWVNSEGFEITARDESVPDTEEHPTGDYDVWLFGSAAQ